jgi:predicted transcriptional regulator
MTLRLTDEQSEALRVRAEAEGRSMQAVVQDAVQEYIERHALIEAVERSLDRSLPRYADLLRRLAE